MLGKNMGSVKKLAKRVKVVRKKEASQYESLIMRECKEGERPRSPSAPTGFFTVYVGEERRRFVVPMGYLSHPLCKILLEKSYNEFGFEQQSRLVVPCSVAAFQEVVSAMKSSHGKFDFGHLVEEFI